MSGPEQKETETEQKETGDGAKGDWVGCVAPGSARGGRPGGWPERSDGRRRACLHARRATGGAAVLANTDGCPLVLSQSSALCG